MAVKTRGQDPGPCLNVAEAKKQFSELLGRVAFGGETILITRRGRPMAKLVPVEPVEAGHLAEVRGWLDEDDPYFSEIEAIVDARASRVPRVLAKNLAPNRTMED